MSPNSSESDSQMQTPWQSSSPFKRPAWREIVRNHFLMRLKSLMRYAAIDALIVGAETLNNFLAKKPSWTGRMVLLTDGENPIEIGDWEAIAKKLNSFNVRITIVYVTLPSLHTKRHR